MAVLSFNSGALSTPLYNDINIQKNPAPSFFQINAVLTKSKDSLERLVQFQSFQEDIICWDQILVFAQMNNGSLLQFDNAQTDNSTEDAQF